MEYKVVNGTSYPADTPDAVVSVLENARLTDKRIRIFLGHADGRDWGEENDVTGEVGRSAGRVKIPILLANKRSTGGGSILTDCIVKIMVNGRTVYQHENYSQPVYTVGAPYGCEGKPEYKAGVYEDGENVANFRSELAACRWVDFMTGKRMSK